MGREEGTEDEGDGGRTRGVGTGIGSVGTKKEKGGGGNWGLRQEERGRRGPSQAERERGSGRFSQRGSQPCREELLGAVSRRSARPGARITRTYTLVLALSFFLCLSHFFSRSLFNPSALCLPPPACPFIAYAVLSFP